MTYAPFSYNIESQLTLLTLDNLSRIHFEAELSHPSSLLYCIITFFTGYSLVSSDLPVIIVKLPTRADSIGNGTSVVCCPTGVNTSSIARAIFLELIINHAYHIYRVL